MKEFDIHLGNKNCSNEGILFNTWKVTEWVCFDVSNKGQWHWGRLWDSLPVNSCWNTLFFDYLFIWMRVDDVKIVLFVFDRNYPIGLKNCKEWRCPTATIAIQPYLKKVDYLHLRHTNCPMEGLWRLLTTRKPYDITLLTKVNKALIFMANTVEAWFSKKQFSGKPRFKGYPSENMIAFFNMFLIFSTLVCSK